MDHRPSKSRTTVEGAALRVAAMLVLLAGPAGGLYLDEHQDVSLRLRLYSQMSVRISDSQKDTVPTTKAGQLVQHRNFFNPELDADLTRYTRWLDRTFLSWLRPDEFGLRVAAWVFYDGIYDWGADQFAERANLINSTFGQVRPEKPRRAWIFESREFRPPPAGEARRLHEIFPGAEALDPRDIYAHQRRINELYLNYVKGRFFLRLGRQFISWGESDTIALLDQNDPFDVTVAAPGLFLDVEEARIPLWTIRAGLNLFSYLGPFSSGFLEAYWVPGDIDTNTGFLALPGGASPYGPRQPDPQERVPPLLSQQLQTALIDRIPRKTFENSRWGFRFQTIFRRAYTLQAWVYTYFPNAPVPRGLGVVNVTDGTSRVPVIVTETVHRKSLSIGASNSFFLESLDGIVRMQLSYYENEPGFIPEKNLCTEDDPLNCKGTTEPADFLRWELGFDRFFFFRPLNPTNSFTLVAAVVGSWNLDETGVKDFRFNGQFKPGRVPPGQAPATDDFVQLKKVETFAQLTLQTDYLHGRLTPRLSVMADKRGTHFVAPEINYRWSDSLLFQLKAIYVGGEYQGVGFFRDRDQVSLRATWQLN